MLDHEGQAYEKLISLEEITDDNCSANDPLCNVLSGATFEQDINRLKHNSSIKFKKKWEEILEKYSAIDDDLESDEIDLHTGKITIDNGHIRSLAEGGQTIDGVRLHGSIWADDYDNDRILKEEERTLRNLRKIKHKMREKLKNEDRFYNSSPITPSDSEILEDNLLLLSLPRKLSISPLKRKLLPFGYFLPSPVKRSLTLNSSPVRDCPDNCRDREEGYRDDTSELCDLHENAIVSLFCCAFPSCNFTSESKSLYRNHLLRTHNEELYRIGYPVTGSKKESISVPELTILKLNLHFPLKVSVPESAYRCDRALPSGKCKKIFLSSCQLAEHQKHMDKCTTQRQILLCPILGCDFRVENYDSWRNHVNSHESRPLVLTDTKVSMDSVEEFFSDSSSFRFSDEEEHEDIKEETLGRYKEQGERNPSDIDFWQARTQPSGFDIVTDEELDVQ